MTMWMRWKAHYLSHSACARWCDTVNKRKMRLCAQTMRAQALWVSVEVVIDIRILHCHANMDVWCLHRAVPRNHGRCHWRPRHALSRNPVQSTIMNFPLLVQFSSCCQTCISSSSLLPVAILCTLLHRENIFWDLVLTPKEDSTCNVKKPSELGSVETDEEILSMTCSRERTHAQKGWEQDHRWHQKCAWDAQWTRWTRWWTRVCPSLVRGTKNPEGIGWEKESHTTIRHMKCSWCMVDLMIKNNANSFFEESKLHHTWCVAIVPRLRWCCVRHQNTRKRQNYESSVWHQCGQR